MRSNLNRLHVNVIEKYLKNRVFNVAQNAYYISEAMQIESVLL